MVRLHHLDAVNAPIVVQSFELNNLVKLRDLYRFRAKEVLPSYRRHEQGFR